MNDVLFTLTKSKTLTQGDLNSALDEITFAAANTLKVERVSVWLYNSDRSKIHCLKLYEKSLNRYTSGMQLKAVSYPAYFKALETQRTIAAHDAYTDPRTSEFAVEYLPALGVTSLLDAPIWQEGEMVGVICHEHTGTIRQWTLAEQNFAGCIADLISLALEASERQKAQTTLAKRERYLATLVEVQRLLLAEHSDGNCYAQIIEQLGLASGASRVYLFENYYFPNRDFLSSQSYLWYAQDIYALANPAEKFTLASVLPRWAEVLGKGEIIASIVAELPESEREILSRQKTLSILVLPLKVNNQFWGFIGFDNCVEARLWEALEIDLLGAAVAAISLHLERALAQQHLAQAKEELEIRVERRTKALKKANQQLLVEIAERTAAQRAQAHLYAQAQEAAAVAQQHSQKLQQALEELTKAQSLIVQSEKMSSLGQLVAGVAHEINNPISFISGNLAHANQYILELLDILHLYQEYYPEPAPTIQQLSDHIDLDFLLMDVPKLLTSMQVGAQRISQIVISLRNFARLDEADLKSVNLHEGIDNTLLILQHRLKFGDRHREIQIIKDYGNLPAVECYPGKLNQVFMNIINNAIDALTNREWQIKNEKISNSPYPMPTIWIRTEVSPPRHVRVRIADNGVGMSEDIKARVFDPFFTTKPVGSGTGLGLSISYQIVVEHQGVLSCTSEPGQGTEFCIEIPICQTSSCSR
ncbi:GAF domain-containing sensor histidine kinase [Iningainema tapete]|uniref:histidine kinase n=1 Tax=Iningainema tapete BLCC-T55 TaxID=2748662 RepID=A0A8J6XIE4_9CYAN|nr:ATP-binding protein [Iningainema tapete]MBD2770782.1 GAF domain-containing protein [Iningainema tapete BLCC-T55]